METKCECPLAGYCNRHKVMKTPHLHSLCQNHTGYFNMWENCKGPGQDHGKCISEKEYISTETTEVKNEFNKESPQVFKEPSLLQKAKNLATSAKDHVLNGMKSVSPEEKQRRLEICNQCIYFDKENIKCKNCGCFLNVKANWESSKCPIDKW